MPFRRFILCTATLVLSACSSSPSPTLTQFTHYSAGYAAGDATSFYWLTEQLNMPASAADYVTAGDYGWYQSEYRWRQGQLRELVREGEQHLPAQEIQRYRIHVRFNPAGEAVYQSYRLGNKILPLQPQQLERYQAEAQTIVSATKAQAREGQSLVQGYWDGETFETCDGRDYNGLEFNQTLPSFVITRLASVDSYVAFVGSAAADRLAIRTLLQLAEGDVDCIERPQLLDD
ncbi:DUF1481 domain-containing protein [Vibrio sp. SM6]|uniref:DUF1481 domain-containing protein n=1 Tax=Vibrio agarilyticus TaxID=2726741 RepID=A0A7X8YI31_9VIBR|nr:DUF1481 domain-containing protein [Vibrio agarilyticus]NLS13972.1 DUF1481 domain-containing protein [Vibrio agarilyticus]